MSARPRVVVRRPIVRRSAALAAGAACAACVPIETAPNGVQSARFDAPPPPSIVAGDVLRDSAGVPTALRAVAFDGDDRAVETARVRYSFVPAGDTAAGTRDTTLVVDSATGVVRATRPLGRTQGRVAAVVGERLQLLQTFEVVFAPDSVVPATDTIVVLRYDCTDPRAAIDAAPDTGTGFRYNAVALPQVTVSGADAAGTRGGIRSRLVRWDVDSGPFAGGRIPLAAPVAGGRDSVPAVAVIGAASDVRRPVDTTAASTGTSTVRLRIRPQALGRDAVAARDFTVRVRGRAQPGPVPLANNPVYFRVRLARNPTPPAGAAPTCQ